MTLEPPPRPQLADVISIGRDKDKIAAGTERRDGVVDERLRVKGVFKYVVENYCIHRFLQPIRAKPSPQDIELRVTAPGLVTNVVKMPQEERSQRPASCSNLDDTSIWPEQGLKQTFYLVMSGARGISPDGIGGICTWISHIYETALATDEVPALAPATNLHKRATLR